MIKLLYMNRVQYFNKSHNNTAMPKQSRCHVSLFCNNTIKVSHFPTNVLEFGVYFINLNIT